MLCLVQSRCDSFIDATSGQEHYLDGEVPFGHLLPMQLVDVHECESCGYDSISRLD